MMLKAQGASRALPSDSPRSLGGRQDSRRRPGSRILAQRPVRGPAPQPLVSRSAGEPWEKACGWLERKPGRGNVHRAAEEEEPAGEREASREAAWRHKEDTAGGILRGHLRTALTTAKKGSPLGVRPQVSRYGDGGEHRGGALFIPRGRRLRPRPPRGEPGGCYGECRSPSQKARRCDST